MFLTLQTLDQAQLVVEKQHVQVPEWDCTVVLRVMTGAHRDAYEDAIALAVARPLGEQIIPNYRAWFLSMCICDEQGKLLCTTEAHVQALAQLNSRGFDRLIPIAKDLNGLTQASADALEKKEASVRNGVSGSD